MTAPELTVLPRQLRGRTRPIWNVQRGSQVVAQRATEEDAFVFVAAWRLGYEAGAAEAKPWEDAA